MFTTTRPYLPTLATQLVRTLIVYVCMSVSAVAAERFCPAPQTDDQHIEVSADKMQTNVEGYAQLSGNVQVTQGNHHLRADQVQYHQPKNIIRAKDQVLYTNCGAVSPAWFVAADKISLSQRQAVAESAWLVVGNLPVAYFPRYRIFLDNQRASGFLTPDVSISSDRGIELGLPYYLNIAPNQDATLTPRYFGKRGLQLDNEYRYLAAWGEGKLNGDWLDDRDYNDDRYSYRVRHRYANQQDLRFNLDYQRISDVDYADDIGTSLHFNGQNYLRSFLNLDYVWNGWQFNVFGDTLQAADADRDRENRPYEIRPRIAVAKNFYPGQTGLTFDFRSEWTHFDYRGPESVTDRMDGERFDNQLGVSWSYRRPGFHFTPRANIRYTDYNLDDQDDERDNVSRTVPTFSARSGLIFEKSNQYYQRSWEPEIFYLNVPERSQDDIPIFDTGRTEFRFAELFSENRFNGADRVGDADQLSLALTHRLMHQRTGKEVLRASLGQIYYFRKNSVHLPDETIADHSDSNIAAELMFDLNGKVQWHSAALWDDDNDHTAHSVHRLALNAGNNRLINLYYRYRRGDDGQAGVNRNGYEQAGINFHIPVGERWQLLSGWSHDLRNKESLELLGGVEYQSCCWSLRLLGQRILKDVDGDEPTLADGELDYDTIIGLELNFRGLGSVANYSEDLLENSIFNYQAR